jgi:uncharacterized protein (DUF2267 family)
MTQGVLQAFRRRLSVKDAVDFANVLPVCLRALFVTDWDLDEPVKGFGERGAMTEEVRSLRAEHNFSPDTAIRDVARALRRHVDEDKFDQVLSRLPPGAIEFWNP